MRLLVSHFVKLPRFYSQYLPCSNSRDHDMTKVIALSKDAVNSAVEHLRQGQLIALPTDTVYGVAADLRSSLAVDQLYRLKKRDFKKPIAICVGEVESVKYWGDTTFLPDGLLNQLLPGPVTVVLKRSNPLCDTLNPGISKVGIRVPDYNFIRDVASALGSAIALTSANLTSEPSTLSPIEFQNLWPHLGAVFDGGKLSDSEASRAGSTIIDLSYKGHFSVVRTGSALSVAMKAFFRNLEVQRRETALKEALVSQLETTSQSVYDEYRDNLDLPSKNEAINALCTIIEAMFIHGLKETLGDKVIGALGDPDRRPAPEFWSPLMVFSHRDVITQINKMTQITTDIGKSRAWVRLALNEGLMVSYLQSILQQNNGLNPYYKKMAFLRDSKMVESSFVHLTKIAGVPFSYPTNSSFLNVWNNGPLLMAGIWTPPIKISDIPATVSGTDIAQTLSSAEEIPYEFKWTDNTYESVSSSPRFGLDEEAALKVVLSTPIQGSPLQSRLYLLEDQTSESRSSTPDRQLKDDVEQVSQENNQKPDVKIVEEPQEEETSGFESLDEKEKPSVKVEDSEVPKELPQVKPKETLVSPTMQSYESILESYNRSPLQAPNLADVINKFDPLDSSLHSSCDLSSETDDNQVINMGYEVITLTSAEPLKMPEFKSLVKQLGKLMQEAGLDTQNYTCKDCDQVIGVSSVGFRVCSFSGSYYCVECFKGEDLVIPARIIRNWDYTRYSVCGKSASFLKEIKDYPLLDIRKLNPRLYLTVREMMLIQTLRLQLNLLRGYILTCRRPIVERLQKMVWPQEYLYEHVHLYSISDLLNIPSGNFELNLKKVIKFCEDHVHSCDLCSQKGFICEICKDVNVIFPFKLESTHRCPKCSAVYHSECFKSLKKCKKCLRIEERRAAAEASESDDGS